MPDDRDAPWTTKELLSGSSTHVRNICVVDRKPKDPAGWGVQRWETDTFEELKDISAKYDLFFFQQIERYSCNHSVCSLPLQFSAPQYVFLAIHQHREMLVFTLFDGIGSSGDSSHFSKLKDKY